MPVFFGEKEFQPRDVAEALDLLLHMVTRIAEREKPDTDDIGRVRELIAQIKNQK